MAIPKVSILSTFYNDKEMMKMVMDSITSQDYPNLEHIITDGGSTDGSVELLMEYEKRYADKGIALVWTSERDKGLYDGFNKATKMMTGDFFIIMTDPYVDKGIISLIVSKFSEGEYDYSYGGINFLRNGKIARQWSGRGGHWRFGWMAATPTLCMRRKIYEKHRMFNEKYKAAADYDLQIRIFMDKELKGCSIRQPLVNYIAGGTSNGGLKANLYCIKECQKILWDNRIKCAVFTNMCKTATALFAYIFTSRRKVDL